jgi:hypothetical protein
VPLCLASGAVGIALAVQSFTLSWTHTVERTQWREHWRVTPAGLVLERASVKGSGAGMEVPENAVLIDGAWHYRLDMAPQTQVVLANSAEGGGWTLCAAHACDDVATLLRQAGAPAQLPITVKSCPATE